MDKNKPKFVSKEEALIKLQKYCAYQDRCHQEVRKKLLDLGLYGDELEQIIVDLIEERFLDEERFARSYARGKFRVKSWGRIRIRQELKQRNISSYCLKKALEEIEDNAYQDKIVHLIEKKNKIEKEKNLYKRKGKLAQYVIQKGFESHLVWKMINELYPYKKGR